MSIIPGISPVSPGACDIDYPSSDGRPVAETPLHRDVVLEMIQVLDAFFAERPMTYVSGNMMLYYAPGRPYKSVAPDVFVVHGVPKDKLRDSYRVWEEDGHAPDVVIEVTSRKTRKQDEGRKLKLYRDTPRVSEYFLFDPRSEYLKPQLKGYRLEAGEYVEIEPLSGRLPSQTLGLRLEPRGNELRLYEPRTKRLLPTAEETRQELASARAEIERLRRELDELRGRAP